MKRNTYLKPVPNNLYTPRVGDYLSSSTGKPVANEDLYIIEGNHSGNKLNDRRNIMSIEEKIKNDKETNLPAEDKDTPKHKRLIILLSKISAKFKMHFYKRKNVINQINMGGNSVQIGIQNIYVNDKTDKED